MNQKGILIVEDYPDHRFFGLQALWPRKVVLYLLLWGLSVTLSLGVLPRAVQAAGVFQKGTFTNAHGTRRYKLYIPSGYQGQAVPLLVMLHGCTQNPDDFAAGTKMNTLAEQQTVLVVYPEQPASASFFTMCWNWFLPAHQQRGSGEPALLAGLTQNLMEKYQVDATRVYVAGLSAGGAMAVILGATYPDLYAAIGVSAGFEYQAARTAAAVAGGEVGLHGGPDPQQQGMVAYHAAGAAARVVPVIVFQGVDDGVVNPVNAYQVLSQWAQTNDLASDGGVDNDNITATGTCTPGQVPNGHAYTKCVYSGDTGTVLMEGWLVYSMRHCWSGGSQAGSYTDPKGPDASQEILRFFAAHPKPSPSPVAGPVP